jgi:hypothetical protein
MLAKIWLKGSVSRRDKETIYIVFMLRDGFKLTTPFHHSCIGKHLLLNGEEAFAKGTIDSFTQPYIVVKLPNNVLEVRTTDLYYSEKSNNPKDFIPFIEVKTVPAIDTPIEVNLYGDYKDGIFRVQGNDGPIEFNLNIQPIENKGRWMVHTFGSYNDSKKSWTVQYFGAIFETPPDVVEPIKIDRTVVRGKVVEFQKPVEVRPGETLQVNYKVDDKGDLKDAKAKNLTTDPDPDCDEPRDSNRVKEATPGTIKYDSGAQRSDEVEEFRYDLFHPIFMKRVARVWAVGAERYGAQNWELGFPMWTLFNHLLGHLWDYLSGNRSEDHLAHMGCNLVMLVVEDEMRYDSNRDYLREPGSKLSPECRELIKNRQEEIKCKKEEKAARSKTEDTLDWNLENFIAMKLLELHRTGVIRYAAGWKTDFRSFARTYFGHLSFHNLRIYLEKLDMHIDKDEMITNIQWQDMLPTDQSNAKLEQAIIDCGLAISQAVQEGKLTVGTGTLHIPKLEKDILEGRWTHPVVLAALAEANFKVEDHRVQGISRNKEKA